ncbi:MAG: hypothetical protein K0S76_2201 [Herbinix sp.]|jgi:hypothetical protein|nr:hypothetical protein [Herbinix sp.]
MKKSKKSTLEQLFETMMSQENAEMTQKENMKNFYILQTGATEEAAEEAVSGILNGVAHFSEKFDQCKDDKEKAKTNLAVALRNALDGLSLEEQYELMRNTLYTLQAISIDTIRNISEDVKSKEERIENIRGGMPTAEDVEVKPELIQEMIDKVTQGIDECGTVGLIHILASANEDEELDREAYVKALQNKEKMNEFVSNEWDNMKVKNYAALATYIMYQRGEIPELPDGMNAEGIGVLSAAEIESGNAIKDAREGRTTWDKAMDILKTIALVATTCLVLYAAVTILSCYVTLALLAPSLSITLFFVGLGYLTYLGMKAVAGSVMEGVQAIADFVVVPAEVLRGAVKVLSSWASSVVNWVKGKFGGLQNRQKENSSHVVSAELSRN